MMQVNSKGTDPFGGVQGQMPLKKRFKTQTKAGIFRPLSISGPNFLQFGKRRLVPHQRHAGVEL